jgi:translocation and assembly module TamB
VKARWKRWLRNLLLLGAAAALVAVVLVETGMIEHQVRRIVVHQLEQRTGARVEMGEFHLHIWLLRAEIDDLTLHGLEASSAPPLFHAPKVSVGIRIISMLSRKFALDELTIERPQVAVRFEKNGQSNLPSPKFPRSSKPWRETLFDWEIGKLALRDGSAIINAQQIPLRLQGQNFAFLLQYEAPASGAESYVGNFRWKQVEMAEHRHEAFRFDVSSKFTLHRDSFELDELVWKLPHSELNLRAELPSLSQSDWNLRYRGRLSLSDVRTILREHNMPDGIADFSGQARYASGEWTANGHYDGHDIRLPYEWFHAGGMQTWGDYEVANRQLVVPQLSVRALGGTVDGRLEMSFDNLAFKTETRLRGVSLAAAFDALENKNFPVESLHWDSRIDADSVNTWQAAFQHFQSKGESRWSPPENPEPGKILMAARFGYDYSEDRRGVALQSGQITSAKTRLEMNGTLGAVDSALEVKLHTDELLDWDDFINVLLGPGSEPTRIAGSVDWRGRILGPIKGPTFAGHLKGSGARYNTLHWDEIEGDMEYSPDLFRLTKTTVRRGRTSASLELFLEFDGDWSFLPQSRWTLDARLEHAPTQDVQAVFDTKYPVTGFLSGQFHGGGTHGAPVMDANFVLTDITAKGIQLDRLSGQLHVARDEIRLSGAELRRDTGRVTGDIVYRPQELEAEYHIVGGGIALEKLGLSQKMSIPVAGRLEFDLHARGSILAPSGQGSLRIADMKLGTEAEGDLAAQVSSDGKSLNVGLASQMTTGKLEGQVNIGLAGGYPISGRLAVEQFDMDAFIIAGLHLKQLTGHSSVDGIFTIAGALRQPDTLQLDAEIRHISFDYDFVKLQNEGPVRLTYRRNEVRVEQAHLKGPNTDVQISGSARFDRERPLHLAMAGGINLRFLGGFIPDLEAQGAAEINVSVEGTMSRPRITGRVSLEDGTANYADFPVGLSHVNGDLVFDTSRLLFDHVTADSGGGKLTLSGNVTYGEGDLRYEINANTSAVRIRYPAGMSWQVGGALQLAGSSNAALLTGRVEVKRLLFAEGADIGSLFAAGSDASLSPATTSRFLRNLSFDVEGYTSPGARIEWASAHVEIEGDVRLRGTWDHPVLLGHVHLLGGEMEFRGNKFELTRGDINFANPFRLDPVLNVEGTATISQYQVTITFSGPVSRLSLNYRSDPPLPDSDIIALLALGSTGEESALRSSASGSQNYGATALLSEAISSGLGGRIERLFGISHFRVDPFLSGTTTESNAAARVTVVQQVTRDLTITYSSNASTSNQYQLIQVEYAVKRDLSVLFLRDINGTYGFDVKFVKRFK